MRRLSLAILMAATTWVGTAIPETDEFKQAINYVFSGNIEGKTPQLLSSIVDEDKCVISVETPGNSWVYYLKEIKPDSIVIDQHKRKISFEGDSTIVEHTFEGLPRIDKDNKNTITLRGDIERTKDALKVLYKILLAYVRMNCWATILATFHSISGFILERVAIPQHLVRRRQSSTFAGRGRSVISLAIC
jgi:hypothetical protein